MLQPACCHCTTHLHHLTLTDGDSAPSHTENQTAGVRSMFNFQMQQKKLPYKILSSNALLLQRVVPNQTIVYGYSSYYYMLTYITDIYVISKIRCNN